jgi:CRP-like cAMP-binding protein
MEHSICTLTIARIALVPRGIMEKLIETRPAITRAFWWTQLVDEDTLRAWIVSMGRRTGLQRVAHLMCELYVRARNIGLTEGDSFELPLTQTVIGDALGFDAHPRQSGASQAAGQRRHDPHRRQFGDRRHRQTRHRRGVRRQLSP